MLMQQPKPVAEDAGRALNLGVGLVSPLWPTFMVTASAGVAYWWWTQWTQIQDRSFAPAATKPLLKLVEKTTPAAVAEPVLEAAAEASEPVLEAAAEASEAVSETVQEAVATTEAAVEQVADTVVEQTVEVAEAVSPAVEQTARTVQAAAPLVEEPVKAVAEAIAAPVARKRTVAAKTSAVKASSPKPLRRGGKRTRTPE
ncbi:MAG: hypothetical protein ABIO37_12725 [Caulobacteraceae bacterium]